jgi:hypothetical protein
MPCASTDRWADASVPSSQIILEQLEEKQARHCLLLTFLQRCTARGQTLFALVRACQGEGSKRLLVFSWADSWLSLLSLRCQVPFPLHSCAKSTHPPTPAHPPTHTPTHTHTQTHPHTRTQTLPHTRTGRRGRTKRPRSHSGTHGPAQGACRIAVRCRLPWPSVVPWAHIK